MDSASLDPQKPRIFGRILKNLRNSWMNGIIGQALIDLMQGSCEIVAGSDPPEHGKRPLSMSFKWEISVLIRFAQIEPERDQS